MSAAAMTLSFDQQAHAVPAPIAAPHQQRLPSGLREDFAAHFGADFDNIGIAPTAAAPAVTANGADAVTVGDDIAFGHAAYQPESGWGRELIGHELAHVVQQRGGTGGPPLTDPAAYEHHAAARAALAGHDVPALSAAPAAAQPRVSMRDVGRGEQSGFGRVPELMDRLNHISLGLVFTLTHEGRFDWLTYTRILPVDLCSEFDKQMMAFIDDGADILMRFTNRHGLLGNAAAGFHWTVNIDEWQPGYIDIDDLLASSDLGLSTSMVHQLRERQATPNYEHRIGIETGPGALVTTPGARAEFESAHLSGLQADPGCRPSWRCCGTSSPTRRSGQWIFRVAGSATAVATSSARRRLRAEPTPRPAFWPSRGRSSCTAPTRSSRPRSTWPYSSVNAQRPAQRLAQPPESACRDSRLPLPSTPSPVNLEATKRKKLGSRLPPVVG
jgi:hypothetical protein